MKRALDKQWRQRVASPLVRRYGHPSLYELSQECSGPICKTPQEALEAIVGRETAGALAALAGEFGSVWTDLESRLSMVSGRHPELWALERGPAMLLYCLTRMVRPGCVVETGVADGLSTFVFLRALGANGDGSLHSIDVSEVVAPVLSPAERSNWDLHVLPEDRRAKAFISLTERLPAPDLFFHDSDHSYAWQSLEYEMARRRMRRGSLLLSDDIDASYAFVDGCHRMGRQPALFLGELRMFGAVWL